MSCEIVTDQSALRQVSTACDTGLTPENKEIVEKLLSSLPSDALGLSSPQIGVFKRMFVARVTHGTVLLINPKITWKSPDTIPSEEGCLSLPDTIRCVERHQSIKVGADVFLHIGNDTHVKNLKNLRLKGLDACVIQHEYDHLEGVLLVDLPEIPTVEQKLTNRNKKRSDRIQAQRYAKKLSQSNGRLKTTLSKPKKRTQKEKNKTRNYHRKLKMRVEIQERLRAEREGLFNSSDDKS